MFPTVCGYQELRCWCSSMPTLYGPVSCLCIIVIRSIGFSFAQAQILDIPIVTADSQISAYDVDVLSA